MGYEFYVDVTSSFLLMSCLWKGKTEDLVIIWKNKIYFIRVFLGFICNMTYFVVVCVVNKDMFIEGPAAKGLFGIIIIHVAIMYSTELCVVCATSGRTICKTKYFLELSAHYKVNDIIYDIMLIFYSIVISDWLLTYFTLGVTIILCVDILLNLIVYIKACCDVYQTDEEASMPLTVAATWCPMCTIIELCCGYDDE